MTGYQTKRSMAQERLAILESPSPGVSDMIRVEQLEREMADMTDVVYEHEVVTTVRITVRSLEPMLSKERFLEDYAYLTDFSVLLGGEDYPRIVQTSVINDEIEYFDKELYNE
jgi:hypothetical protein